MYKYIKNPKTNTNVKLNSKLGRKIINNYIIFLRGGVSSEEEEFVEVENPEEEEFVEVENPEEEEEFVKIEENPEEEFVEIEENPEEEEENPKQDYIGQLLEDYEHQLKLNKNLSKESKYSLIFNTHIPDRIVKCVFITPVRPGITWKPKYFVFHFSTMMETEFIKKSQKIEEFDNECDKFKLMSEHDISPKLYECATMSIYDFKNLLFDIEEVFGEKLKNFYQFTEIDNLKVGIIVMEFLKDYSTIWDNLIREDFKRKDQIFCKPVAKHLKEMHKKTKHKHCDLHQDNILYNPFNNNIKFIDFSKSEPFDRDYSESNIWDAEENCSGYLKGTIFSDLHRDFCPILYSSSKS